MTFQYAIKTCFSKYAEFKGTTSRSEYWWFSLFIVLGTLAANIVSQGFGALFSLIVLLPSLAAATRRLHDTDRSGWWQLIVFLAQDSRDSRF